MIVTSMVVMLLANVGPVPVDGMSCFGYCSRCDTIHTLPTTAGAKKAASILRRKILPSMTQYLNHPNNRNDNHNNNHNNKYDISLPDHWWIEKENQIETGVKNDTNQNEGFELELDARLETELLLDGSSSASALSSFSSPLSSSSNNSSLSRILLPIRRGKMIGVVEVYNTTSQDLRYLAGYAGKLNGHWRQPGWVSPIVVPEQVPAFVQCATKVTTLTTHINKLEQEIIEQENELTPKTNNTTTTTDTDTITTATATAPTATIPAATTMIRMKLLQSERKKYATEGLRSLQKAQVVSNFRQQNDSTAIPNAYNSHNISSSSSNTSGNSSEKRRKRKDRRKNKKQNRRQLWKDQEQQQQPQQKMDASVLVDTHKNDIATTTSTSRIMNMPPIQQRYEKQHKKQRLVPGGVGDCAAPKLLNAIHVINNAHLMEQQQQAEAETAAFAKLNLTQTEATATATQLPKATPLKLPLPLLIPLGIAEIFVGPTGGMSTQKYDGRFYDSCPQRCQPIMGYLLCGLEALQRDDRYTLY